MTCSACGADNETAAKFCHACGHAMSAAVVGPPSSPRNLGTIRGSEQAIPGATGKNPLVAAVLGLVVPGLGQFYTGDVKKGAVMLVGAFVLGVFSAGLLWIVIAVWSAVDAYKVASGTGKMW